MRGGNEADRDAETRDEADEADMRRSRGRTEPETNENNRLTCSKST